MFVCHFVSCRCDLIYFIVTPFFQKAVASAVPAKASSNEKVFSNAMIVSPALLIAFIKFHSQSSLVHKVAVKPHASSAVELIDNTSIIHMEEFSLGSRSGR